MPKKKKLTLRQRRAIAAGLRRYHAEQRRAAKRRSARARAAARTRKMARQVKEAQVSAKRVRRADKRAPAPVQRVAWEVTIRYKSGGQVVDITVRVMAPATASQQDVIGAVWLAGKGVTLTTMQVDAINWRRQHRGRVHDGSSDDVNDLHSFRSMMFKSTIRAAPVEEPEEWDE